MNELTKSVLRRARYIHEQAATRNWPDEDLVITEEELKALSWDLPMWAKTYALQIDGVKIKVK